MTDIAALIEQATGLFAEGYRGAGADLLHDMVEALFRIATSPLPEEIAGLLALREGLPEGPWTVSDWPRLVVALKCVNDKGGNVITVCREEFARAIAALPSLFTAIEAQAQDIEFWRNKCRELEAERDAFKAARDNQTDISMTLAGRCNDYEREIDAIKAETIEECAREAERHPWPTKTAESMWDIERTAIARAIRALMPSEGKP